MSSTTARPVPRYASAPRRFHGDAAMSGDVRRDHKGGQRAGAGAAAAGGAEGGGAAAEDARPGGAGSDLCALSGALHAVRLARDARGALARGAGARGRVALASAGRAGVVRYSEIALDRLRGELLVADVERGARTDRRRWRPCTFFVDDHALCWESSRLPLVAVRSVAVRRAASAEFAIEASEREPLELRAASAEEMLRWVQKLRRGATEAARIHLRDFGWAPGRRRLLAATSEEELRAHEHVASPPAAASKRRGWFG